MTLWSPRPAGTRHNVTLDPGWDASPRLGGAGRPGEAGEGEDGPVTAPHPHHDLLGGPPPTLLPPWPAAEELRAQGADAVTVAARVPADSAAWADLADAALAGGDGDPESVMAYGYARVGYHRGLDQLRRNGWKGHGPVPWEHAPNRGWLRCVAALGLAAGRIGELDEARRCSDLLRDSDPAALAALGDPAT